MPVLGDDDAQFDQEPVGDRGEKAGSGERAVGGEGSHGQPGQTKSGPTASWIDVLRCAILEIFMVILKDCLTTHLLARKSR